MSTEVKIDEKVTVSVQVPKLWKVIFLNDDKTPMEFVVKLLTTIFRHNIDNAKNITLEIHNTGSAVVGIYTHEIAEQRGIDATEIARINGFPLQITLEQEQ
jgi:ATP-dependent Clp protease adaptor protein ClpS